MHQNPNGVALTESKAEYSFRTAPLGNAVKDSGGYVCRVRAAHDPHELDSCGEADLLLNRPVIFICGRAEGVTSRRIVAATETRPRVTLSAAVVSVSAMLRLNSKSLARPIFGVRDPLAEGLIHPRALVLRSEVPPNT